jgi:integrase
VRGTKRKRGEGVWEVRVYIGRDAVTGKPKQVSKTIHGGSRAADAALRDLIENQAPSRVDGVGATVGQLLDQWLQECERLDLSPTTMRTYRAQIKQTIRPRLGKVPLNRLTSKHLDDLYGAMKTAGQSPKTIRNHHAILSSALHQAARWGWVRDNVAEMAKPPRVTQRRVTAPSVDVVRSVIVAAEEHDPRLAPLLMLAALTGMRRGELCALRWSDVDLNVGQLDVSRSVVVVPGGVAEKSTKTHRGRSVALDEVGVALLTRYRAQVDDWASQADGIVPDDAFVFSPELDGSQPFRPDHVTSFFIRVRSSLGLEGVRLHDLRHFTATQLIGAGVDVRTVAGRLGHDASVTLRIYSHVIEERDRAAAVIMGRVLEPGPTAAPALEAGPVKTAKRTARRKT